MTDETKALIDKANQLHAQLMEKKKIQSAYWDRYHAAGNNLASANQQLNAGMMDLERWKEIYAEWIKNGEVDVPRDTDATEWLIAKQEAMEAIAQDLGLRLRLDGL